MSYADFQLFSSPTWLQRGDGGKWQTALGTELDVELDKIRQAIRSSMPDGNGPADALAFIGDDRMLPQASGESSAAYAEYLRTAWDKWDKAGSHGALLRAIVRAGFPNGSTGINIVQRTKRYTWIDSGDVVHYQTHGGFTWDTTGPQIWNQFAVVMGADVAGLADGSASADVLRKLIRTWKPAKARCMGIWVMVSGPFWGWPPNVAWGDLGRLWATGSVRFIPYT